MRQNKFYGFMKGFIPVVAAGAVLFGLSRNIGRENSDLVKKLEIPVQAQTQKQNQVQTQENSLIAYVKYTGNFEGRKSKVYDPNPNDGKPEPTIAVGHYLDRKDSRETFARVLPEVDYDAVYSGKQELTNEQIDRLFSADIPKYIERAKRLFPKFDTYPEYLRQALVDGCYRGDLGDSPKTRALINQGKFREAAAEYINRGEYRNAGKNGIRGIVTRMNSNKAAMERYAQELETSP